MITEIDQETLDIDWFFTNGSEIAFVASGGGKLPKSVSKSKENTEALAVYFRSLVQKSDVIINPDLNKVVPASDINERYLSDFVTMAKKGLFSFDKTILNDFSATNYHLVAKPKNPLTVDELPPEILEILTETLVKGEIRANLILYFLKYKKDTYLHSLQTSARRK